MLLIALLLASYMSELPVEVRSDRPLVEATEARDSGDYADVQLFCVADPGIATAREPPTKSENDAVKALCGVLKVAESYRYVQNHTLDINYMDYYKRRLFSIYNCEQMDQPLQNAFYNEFDTANRGKRIIAKFVCEQMLLGEKYGYDGYEDVVTYVLGYRGVGGKIFERWLVEDGKTEMGLPDNDEYYLAITAGTGQADPNPRDSALAELNPV